MSLQFGDFELDRERRQLLRSGQSVPLEPKAYELLVLLVERRPRALSRAQIRDVVWPGVVTSESTLGVAVNAIRQALGDDARQPRFIRTVHGFGYAFCGEVAGDEAPQLREATKAEPRGPYPGLSSFTEEDAEVFFGREAEVEALWERLQRRQLLALIGPSGAGKTSFVRAGVIPARPEAWRALVSVPGRAPLTGLAHALAPEVAGDVEAVQQLVRMEDSEVAIEMMRRWQQEHDEALLVVDQFEELFTLNPPETQARFAALLGRLANEAGVHVLLSLRDDFLIRCSEHGALAPVFTADMTPLLALEREGLRRALVEPAKREGFAFEDDSLVEEMLDSVEGARGALPLLAFAVSRLWEKRDRETGLLTRSAYDEIGGVAGALAQHAEQTLERIGLEREPIVRELFRNLVTAQQTRAAADRDELLSVLPDREIGAHVLDQLIDARLLTSYELRDTTSHPERGVVESRAKDLMPESPAPPRTTHRIEIIHESLLRAWPRLVRWQAQDEEGALLRDQLKQAAHLWDEKGRPIDLLWTGTSEREFELWRDRYPGALTAVENDFAEAMVRRTRRRRRLKKTAVAGVVATALAVAAVVGVSRQQAVRQAERARQESLRAEASKVLALAQLQLEGGPTEALALATASLELSDTREARVFAMKALWAGPPALELPVNGQLTNPVFSPDGRSLAAGDWGGAEVWAWTGKPIARLQSPESGQTAVAEGNQAEWGPGGLLLTGRFLTDRVQVWSLPAGDQVRIIDFEGPSFWGVQRDLLLVETLDDEAAGAAQLPPRVGTYRLRSWRLPDGNAQELGQVDLSQLGATSSWFEPNGLGWLYTKGRSIVLRPLPADGRGDRVVSRHESNVLMHSAGQWPNGLPVFREESGRVHTCCSLRNGEATLTRSFEKPETAEEPVYPEPGGRWLWSTWGKARARLWSTSSWPGAHPLLLRREAMWFRTALGFHPRGDWAVAPTNDLSDLTFWPLRRRYPTVVDGYSGGNRLLVFSPDSRWLATNWAVESRVRLWSVGEDGGQGTPVDLSDGTWGFDVAFDPEGRYLFVAKTAPAEIVPLDGSPVRPLEGFSKGTVLLTAAVSPSGRRVAAAFSCCGTEKTLRVWDLETGDAAVFALPRGSTLDGEPAAADVEWGISDLAFVGESTLYSAGGGGLRRWNLEDGTHELVVAARSGYGLSMSLGNGGERALVRPWRADTEQECHPVQLIELREGTSRALPEFGECVQHLWGFALSGAVAATADRDGLVRVGRLGAGEPHLLAGHEGPVQTVALSPDLRWVASAGEDNTLRLWPMPDLDAPPLHALPHEELLAKLKSLTNLRAVRGAESATGWRIEVGPFPGWEAVPTW